MSRQGSRTWPMLVLNLVVLGGYGLAFPLDGLVMVPSPSPTDIRFCLERHEWVWAVEVPVEYSANLSRGQA